MNQLICVHRCTWNHNFLRRRNNNLRRGRWGCRVRWFRYILQIQLLRLFLFQFRSPASTSAASYAENNMSQYPYQIHNDNDQNRFFNDIGPPVKLMIGQVGKGKRVVHDDHENARNVVKHRVEPTEPVFIGPYDSCPGQVDDHNE